MANRSNDSNLIKILIKFNENGGTLLHGNSC